MSLIPQVTCRRCGTRFSGMRHRCPNCGTRKVTSSSRVPGATPSAVKGTPAAAKAAENRKWQLIFGAILIVAVLVALIVMITVSLKTADDPNGQNPVTPPDISEGPAPSVTPTPTPTPTPEITDLTICYYGDPRTEFTCKVGEEVVLNGSHFPLTVPADYVWKSADPSVATISDGVVTGVASGSTKVTLTCYGKTVECKVYVR